jgi:RNA polymerase sigma factor FliA
MTASSALEGLARNGLSVSAHPGATADLPHAVRGEPDDLVLEHLPLVDRLVSSFAARVPASVDRDDLTSGAMLALVAASRSYDDARGVPFASYATTRIRGALLDELRSRDWTSRSVRRRQREIEAARQSLQVGGRHPTDAVTARALGLSEDQVRQNDVEVSRSRVGWLDGSDDCQVEVPDPRLPMPEEVVMRREQFGYVAAAIAELPTRHRFVIREYYLRERPLHESARVLGVSGQRASQLRAEALLLIREAMQAAFEEPLPPRRKGGAAARRRRVYVDAVIARCARRRRDDAETQ